MTRLFFLALLGSCVAFAEGLTSAQIGDIENAITSEMSAQRIPGLSIAVLTRDGLIWSNGYGLADLENFVPAKNSTVYRTASIAKPITAVAAVQLADAGKLDLDAPIDRYVPEFPKKPWPLTTRQLLGHLAGVRHYRDGAETYLTQHYATLSEAVKVFAEDPLLHPPGTKYRYSTFGFVLAGFVVESVAREPFGSYLHAHVFVPAGMKSTVVDDVYTVIPNRSRGYQKRSDGTVLNAALADTSHKIPGGGLLSTATDLVRFALALGEGKLVKRESVEEMFRSMKTTDGVSTGYGMGWGVSDFLGRRHVSHSGGQAGVSTMLRYFPNDRVSVAVMCNLESVNLGPLTDRIATIALQ